jgi:hypothetical protein
MKLSLDLCRNVLEYGTTKLILHENNFVVNHIAGPSPACHSFVSQERLHPGLRPFVSYALTGPRCLGAENKKPWVFKPGSL